ncbi:thymidine kinase [Cotia virus SPAn232]|uniref:Thymidine kinase n=2 Tax=Cotia virus TaxID=39444 RepID=Q90024_9POXV|nr:thymidine kinase [Cotia virus SPAn232]ADL60426.1 thymidine kinase [Cotia virus]AFB76935.1 thymidine kinase [Cotia virus SPAn232]AIT70697.1 thymidine kinase [Cotia virus]BAA08118.1 thymidine kinase [Cotia virus]
MDGYIKLILGPMFSGKTTELVRIVKRYKIANYKCCVIKYYNDNRCDESIVKTHDGVYIDSISTLKLNDIIYEMDNVDVIGIDEGQFFNDIVEFSENMANKGKIVIVSALDATYQRKTFGNILNLIPLSEKVIKLNAICKICFNDAAFTKRLCDDTKIELIGGEDKYSSVCRKCYFAGK